MRQWMRLLVKSTQVRKRVQSKPEHRKWRKSLDGPTEWRQLEQTLIRDNSGVNSKHSWESESVPEGGRLLPGLKTKQLARQTC